MKKIIVKATSYGKELTGVGLLPAIDDDFLEWFVKNSSYEFVEVERFHGINTSIAEISAVSGNNDYNWKGIGDFRDYKIIIPQEEPKQETLKNYPIIIVRNDDKEEFIHLSNGFYRTKWGILNNSISKTPLESFDKTKFTFYYE